MSDSKLKKQLVKHLDGGQAFLPLEDIIDKMPFEKLGERPDNLPYSFYELFYHITFAQKDIVAYSIAEDYKSSNWPDEFWPDQSAPQTKEEWEQLKEDYFKDRENFKNFILDPQNDLNQSVRNAQKHSLLREILLIIEHSSYHTGQLLVISRLLGLHQ